MAKLDLMYGARRLVTVCTDVQPGEQVMIVIDSASDPELAYSLSKAVQEAKGQAVIMFTGVAETDSGEPLAAVAAAMLASDVVFAIVQVSITHTDATKALCAKGGRLAALTQWVPEMMAGGGISADFMGIEPRVMTVARIWDEGSTVHVSNDAGTDITMDIRGRLGTPHAKTGVVRPGTFHPIPDIESPVSPVTGTGTIVCDASIPYLGIGILNEPVTLEVESGRVVSISGGRAADIVRDAWEKLEDPNVYNLAEIGIGMNPQGRLTGRMLDDESVANTCHFGIGTSNTLGGTIKAKCHYDFVIWNPTIRVDDLVIMRAGELEV